MQMGGLALEFTRSLRMRRVLDVPLVVRGKLCQDPANTAEAEPLSHYHCHHSPLVLPGLQKPTDSAFSRTILAFQAVPNC